MLTALLLTVSRGAGGVCPTPWTQTPWMQTPPDADPLEADLM